MKKKVLFVCIGNCCRSQIAEGLANFYGRDVLTAESAGLAPTQVVATETIDTMRDLNIDISHHYPKRFLPPEESRFDVIVNMSGFHLPGPLRTPVREWVVRDPFGKSPEVYREVCSDIEMRVMQLILEFRREAKKSGEKFSSTR